jgi:hypothetical protein
MVGAHIRASLDEARGDDHGHERFARVVTYPAWQVRFSGSAEHPRRSNQSGAATAEGGSVNQTITRLVWSHCPTKFRGTELVVLLKLAGLSSGQARSYRWVDDLAQECGVKTRALQYITEHLQNAGVLHVQERNGMPNCYTLNREEIRKLPRVKAAQEPLNSLDDLGAVGASDCTI